MHNKAIQIIRIFFGIIFMLFGSLGLLVGIIAIIDPVGTKMADDADPFGTPHTFIESLTITFTYFLVFLLGICLVVGLKHLKKICPKYRLK